MNEQNAIEVRNITKAFKVYLDRSNNIKDFIIHRNRRRFENRQVLRGISFDVKKGEAIGLIGHNGCGKSTTLKLLTRIIYPDSGSIEIKGRVSSLIELGAGFHPDMSGRENIYINASIFGLSKKEIDNRIADMIEFSEMEQFIDNPVRTYSSGMYMRLAFAVAINVDADVLLIDEILAVGDIAFQKKCFDKLKEVKAKGTTIVIVSHALGQIEEICEKTYWIDEGLIRMSGEPERVHLAYIEYMNNKAVAPLRNAALDSSLTQNEMQVWTAENVTVNTLWTYKTAEEAYDKELDFHDYTEQLIVRSQRGKRVEGEPIVIPTSEACYGPYISLKKGKYKVIYDLRSEKYTSDIQTLSITEGAGSADLAKVPIKVGYNSFEIEFNEDYHQVEFVMTNISFANVKLGALKIAKLD